MANVIKPKRSNTANKVPTTSDLSSGEFGVNMADQKSYINNGTSVVQVGSGKLTGLQDVTITSPTTGQSLTWNGTAWVNASGAGSGDVTGPSSATDNAITRFDTTTGKLIQNSTVTLDDDGNIVNANSVQFDTTPTTPPATVGTMSWDDGDGVPSVLLKGGNTTLQVGTQEYARVFNDSGATLTKGQVVYISGAQGNRVAVKLAKADVEATSFGTIGLVAESIANGAEGFIIVSGALYKLNTTGLTAGVTVYLSPTTAGAYTTTKPQAPNQLVVLGWVERISATVGSIYVKIDNGYELDELHDVQVTSPQSGNILIYDASTSPIGVWKNANLTDGTGIAITEGAGSITVANSGVLSVTGTAPVVSSGGQNPAISMAAATTSVNGYLTSTDWNTFNGKQAALVSGTNIKTVNSNSLLGSGNIATGTVTSVSGTGSYGGLTLSGTVTTSGNITLGGTPTGTWPISVSGNSATVTNGVYTTGTQTVGGDKTFSGITTLSGGVVSGFTVKKQNTTGEGGEFYLEKSDTSTLAGNLVVDLNGQTLRFFENGGTARGAYIDISTCAGGAGTQIVTSVPAKMIYDTFTANGSTTSFTTSATYTSGKIEVFCNGVKMRNGSDVTVTSGTAVVFASAPANTSLIDLVYPI
jgi:hypothetical protein